MSASRRPKHDSIKNYFIDKCGKKFVLPAGKYSYPFRFQLPPSLPSSYEGEYGYVRYYIKAAIIKPWRMDHVTKTAFTVSSVLDLNSLPQASVSKILYNAIYGTVFVK